MRIARPATIVVSATLCFGCGARSGHPLAEAGEGGSDRVCPEDQSLHFVRPAEAISCIETGVAQNLVFREEPQWRQFWQQHVTCSDGSGNPLEAPAFDFDSKILVGVMLEAGCTYSGCDDSVALIVNMRRIDCRLRIRTRLPASDELGPCAACVQPRDFATVDRELVGELDEIVFEQ